MVTIEIPSLNSKVTIDAESISSKKVSDFGNGAKIDFMKRFLNREVLVIVPKSNYKLKVGEKCNK